MNAPENIPTPINSAHEVLMKSDIALCVEDVARAIIGKNPTKADIKRVAKHTLLEMAHRLDTQDVRVHAKKDGLLLINGLGKARYATFKEMVLYRVFSVVPKAI